MSDKNWMKSLKNIFSSKKVQPIVQVPKSTNAPRKVNFVLNSQKQQSKTISFGSNIQEKTLNEQIASQKIKIQGEQFQQIPKEIQQQPQSDVDERYQKLQIKWSFKQLQFPKDQILPGQVIILCEKKNIEYRLKKNTYIQGEFILTNYKFVFRLQDKQICFDRNDYLKIPLGLIDKIQKKNQNNRNKQALPKLVIGLKDQRQFKFRIPSIQVLKRINQQINKFAFVTQKRHFFAFRYYQFNKELEEKFNGWKTYNIFAQVERMKLKLMEHSEKIQSQYPYDYKYLDNKDGKICSTYPSILIVPSRISYDYIIRCAKFRSRQRLPVLTYAYQYAPQKFSTMFRCSQNKVGVSRNRCLEDQMMLRMIGDPKTQIKQQYKGSPNCKIYDARAYYAALGNVFGGKGYQLPQFYKNCQIQWLDIPNIHTVRESYVKLKQGALGDDNKYSSALADSAWYDNVFLILAGSKQVANSLLKGINCLVHCSDGWDRTAQLCALAQMIIDPYFRTIEGFQILIQKQWISFGHQFCQRFGQGSNHPTNEQKSPVFIQFIDCVTQIMHQFPLSFEFNYKYLSQIVKLCLTHIFGNFLCNSQLQQIKTSIFKKTISIWSYIRQNKQQFLNPYYQPQWSKILDISTSQKNMRLWKQHFLYYTQGFKDVYSIYSCEWTDQNSGIIFSQLKKQNELLRDKHQENSDLIRLLESQIHKAKLQKVN